MDQREKKKHYLNQLELKKKKKKFHQQEIKKYNIISMSEKYKSWKQT